MSDWISAKKLPRDSRRLIIYKKETDEESGYMEFGRYDCGRWLIASGGLGDYSELGSDDLPTHWQTAPEPPED